MSCASSQKAGEGRRERRLNKEAFQPLKQVILDAESIAPMTSSKYVPQERRRFVTLYRISTIRPPLKLFNLAKTAHPVRHCWHHRPYLLRRLGAQTQVPPLLPQIILLLGHSPQLQCLEFLVEALLTVLSRQVALLILLPP